MSSRTDFAVEKGQSSEKHEESVFYWSQIWKLAWAELQSRPILHMRFDIHIECTKYFCDDLNSIQARISAMFRLYSRRATRREMKIKFQAWLLSWPKSNKVMYWFDILQVEYLTWHLPPTQRSLDPAWHGVPSITFDENWTEILSSVAGVQNNAQGLSGGIKKC